MNDKNDLIINKNNNKAKECCSTSTEAIMGMLFNVWQRQVVPAHIIRESATTPLATALATIIYKGAINGEWEPVSLAFSTLEYATIATMLDVTYRLQRAFVNGMDHYDGNKIKAVADVVLGGFSDNKASFLNIAHGGLWRIIVPGLLIAALAAEMTVYAEDSNDTSEENSWDWGSMAENTAYGAGVGTATGFIFDTSAKALNYGLDLTWYGLRKCKDHFNKKSGSSSSFDYDDDETFNLEDGDKKNYSSTDNDNSKKYDIM